MIPDWKICCRVLEWFAREFPAKFSAGQKAYRTPLFIKDAIKEAKLEVVDLAAYLITAEFQWDEVRGALQKVAEKHPELHEDLDFQYAMSILSAKPTAEKEKVKAAKDDTARNPDGTPYISDGITHGPAQTKTPGPFGNPAQLEEQERVLSRPII